MKSIVTNISVGAASQWWSNEPTQPFNPSCNSKYTRMMFNCTLFSDSEPWCGVHTYPNDSQIQGHYGYCNNQCNGEIPAKSRPEHLVNPLFDKLWSSNIYDLHAWEAGVCHTYTVHPMKSLYLGVRANCMLLLEMEWRHQGVSSLDMRCIYMTKRLRII